MTPAEEAQEILLGLADNIWNEWRELFDSEWEAIPFYIRNVVRILDRAALHLNPVIEEERRDI